MTVALKKIFGLTMALVLCLSAFSFPAAAARTGEFEDLTYVEFTARVPGDFQDTIQIDMIDSVSGYVFSYYLHAINEYRANERVPYGDYTVAISVPDREDDDCGFVYKDEFVVEESAVALPLDVVVYYTSLTGDADETESEETGSNETESGVTETPEDQKEQSNNQPELEVFGKRHWPSLLASAALSVTVFGVGVGVFYFLKKRRDG